MHFQIISNLLLYLLYYAEACNRFAGPISVSLRLRSTPFEEPLQRWRADGHTVSDLTGPRFESLNSRSRKERVTGRPAFILLIYIIWKVELWPVLPCNMQTEASFYRLFHI